MADQKKILLTLFGVILILGGLILGTFAIERYYGAKADFAAAESLLRIAYWTGGGAILSIIFGVILLKIRKKHIVVEDT